LKMAVLKSCLSASTACLMMAAPRWGSSPRMSKARNRTFTCCSATGFPPSARWSPGPSRPPCMSSPVIRAATSPSSSIWPSKAAAIFFNLGKLGDPQVIKAVGSPPFSFISASYDGSVTEVYPRSSQPVHGRFSLSGQLKNGQAVIRLNFGRGGIISHAVDYSISRQQAAAGQLLSTHWAQKKIAELAIFPDVNADKIKSTGQEHGLVTPGTSLIVLESLQQYARHHIAPPESLPEMRARYFELLERNESITRRKKAGKLERVVAMWNRRVDWWKTEFEYPEDFVYEEMQKPRGASRDAAARPMAAAAPQAAPPPPVRRKSKSAKKPGAPQRPSPSISIKPWDPKTPYIEALKQAGPADYLKVYLEQRSGYAGSPAFYLDCASFFFRQNQPELALRALSNITELELDSPPLMRIVAHLLRQKGYLELASLMFGEVKRLRPEEPQSLRDLSLVHDLMGKPQEAIGLLYKVVLGEWDRFNEIELIALVEMNRIIARAQRAGKNLDLSAIDPRLIKLLDLDVRIVLTWDADMTDMDLWVIEPSGEKAFYGHRRTKIGGLVSRDFTRGYGPEEYLLKKAMPGGYEIKVKYFASHAPKLAGAVTLQATVYSNFGRSDEKRQEITLRLRRSKEMLSVGTVSFK
jgi:Ca-activated chloride channel family protein